MCSLAPKKIQSLIICNKNPQGIPENYKIIPNGPKRRKKKTRLRPIPSRLKNPKITNLPFRALEDTELPFNGLRELKKSWKAPKILEMTRLLLSESRKFDLYIEPQKNYESQDYSSESRKSKFATKLSKKLEIRKRKSSVDQNLNKNPLEVKN